MGRKMDQKMKRDAERQRAMIALGKKLTLRDLALIGHGAGLYVSVQFIERPAPVAAPKSKKKPK